MVTTKKEEDVAGIYGKILAIQQEVKGLQKNGVGPSTQGGYKFLAVDDVLNTIKPLLDQHKVIVHASLLDYGFEFTKALAKDDSRVPKVATSSWVKYEFRFIDTEDGSSLSTVVLGEGSDGGDKSVRKSTTSAWKIALIQTFSLITGEVDPDAQDGANVPESAGSASKVSKTDQKLAAATKSSNPVEAKRTELQETATAQDRDFNEVLALGDKITKVGRGVWTSDLTHLDTVITAVKNGEVV
jgi:hypothetical protein